MLTSFYLKAVCYPIQHKSKAKLWGIIYKVNTKTDTNNKSY